MNDELMHYGVKGMKWGVRKEKPTSGEREKRKLTPGQRKALIATGMVIVVGAVVCAGLLARREVNIKKEMDRISGIGKKFLDEDGLMDQIKDVKVPKGTEFSRVASKLETTIDQPKYAAYLKKDVSFYKSHWEPIFNPGSTIHQTKFSAMSDTKIASGRSQLEAMQKSLSGRSAKDIRSSLYGQYGDNRNTKAALKRMSGDSLAPYALKTNVGSGFDSNSGKAMIETLSKRGYSALTDLADSGSGTVDHAVVLFNDAVYKTTSAPLTKLERDAAGEQYKRLLKLAG